MTACRNPHFPDTAITWRMLVTHRSSLMRDVPAVTIDGELVLAHYGPDNFTYFYGPAYGNPTCPLDDLQNLYHAILTPDNVTTLVGGGDIDWYTAAREATDGVGAWSTEPPGSYWEYSNFAITYLAILTELTTNQTFQSYCTNVLFDKLQMSNTAWSREALPSTTVVAHPQDMDGVDIGFYCFADYASGQLHSTANDLAKFLSSILTSKGVEDSLWSDDVANVLFTCQEQDESGNAIPASECHNGLTWFVLDNSKKGSNETDYQVLRPLEQYDWTGGIMHEGVDYGVATVIVILPAENVYLAILNNIAFLDKSGPTLIADAIATTRFATTATPASGGPSPTAPMAAPATVPSVPTGDGTGTSSSVPLSVGNAMLASVVAFLITLGSVL